MDRQEVKDSLIDACRNLHGDGVLSQESDLFEDLFDSLDHMEFIMEAEAVFDIRIDDDEAFECKTFGEFIDLVCGLV